MPSPPGEWIALLTLRRAIANEAAPLARLLASCGTPDLALAAPDSVWRSTCGDEPDRQWLAEAARRAEDDALALQALGAEVIDFRQEDYPASLRLLPQPPVMLFVRGRAGVLGHPGVAMVGTRACTPYGRDAAAAISLGLASAGYAVISGLARGIDAAAHQAAADAGGATIAVLGTGVDVTYPPEHAGLARRIVEVGCLVSEFPPGTPPRKYHFPQRNRLIAGLARAVVVVEADERSGALITAGHALEQGKDVFAVPGPIDAPTSRGTNRLIQDGAGLVSCAADVIDALGPCAREGVGELRAIPLASPLSGAGVASAVGLDAVQAPLPPSMDGVGTREGPEALGTDRSRTPPGTPDAARRVLEAVHQGADDLESLRVAVGEATGLITGVLLELEVAGLVERLPGPRFRPVGGRPAR